MTTILEELAKRKTFGAEVLKRIRKLSKRVNWLRLVKTGGRYALHAGLAYVTAGTSLPASVAAELAAAAKDAKPEEIVEKLGDYVVTAEESKQVHGSVREFETEFAEVLAQTKLRRLVVIIDDLDRCNPSQIIETLEAIRLFLAVPKAAFIVAADERMVQNAPDSASRAWMPRTSTSVATIWKRWSRFRSESRPWGHATLRRISTCSSSSYTSPSPFTAPAKPLILERESPCDSLPASSCGIA